MLETRVFCSWVDPPGGLQLMNLPHPLDPGMVDYVPFRNFSILMVAGCKWNVSVDGIMTKVVGRCMHGQNYVAERVTRLATRRFARDFATKRLPCELPLMSSCGSLSCDPMRMPLEVRPLSLYVPGFRSAFPL